MGTLACMGHSVGSPIEQTQDGRNHLFLSWAPRISLSAEGLVCGSRGLAPKRVEESQTRSAKWGWRMTTQALQQRPPGRKRASKPVLGLESVGAGQQNGSAPGLGVLMGYPGSRHHSPQLPTKLANPPAAAARIPRNPSLSHLLLHLPQPPHHAGVLGQLRLRRALASVFVRHRWATPHAVLFIGS